MRWIFVTLFHSAPTKFGQISGCFLLGNDMIIMEKQNYAVCNAKKDYHNYFSTISFNFSHQFVRIISWNETDWKHFYAIKKLSVFQNWFRKHKMKKLQTNSFVCLLKISRTEICRKLLIIGYQWIRLKQHEMRQTSLKLNSDNLIAF